MRKHRVTLLALIWTSPVWAEPAPAPPSPPRGDVPYRSGLDLAFGVAALGSLSDLSNDYEEVDPYSEFAALGPHFELRLGGFLGRSVSLGVQLSYSHQWTTAPDVGIPMPPSGSSSGSNLGTTLFSPYLTIYPDASSPLFFGGAAGLGKASSPEFSFSSISLVSLFYSLELGYEVERLSSAAFLFYRRLIGNDLEREGKSSHDLGVGWRFRLSAP